jgi:hypothetical protein
MIKYILSESFNIANLSAYHGDEDLESRTSSFQEGRDDTTGATDITVPRSAPNSPTSMQEWEVTTTRANALRHDVNLVFEFCAMDIHYKECVNL